MVEMRLIPGTFGGEKFMEHFLQWHEADISISSFTTTGESMAVFSGRTTFFISEITPVLYSFVVVIYQTIL